MSIELLTVSEAATALGVAPSTVRAWVKQSRLKAIRLGYRTLRVSRDELERLVAGAKL
jgi:excisionase family DNA binding protein